MFTKRKRVKNPFRKALKNIKRNPSIKVISDKTLKLNPSQWSYNQLAEQCQKVWADIVKREWDYKCQWKPFAIEQNLPGNRECEGAKDAHHMLSAQIYNLRYNPINGVCLCRKHHFYTIHKNNLWVKYWLPGLSNKHS